MPVIPAAVSFCFTSSSLKGLIIASIFFIASPLSVVMGPRRCSAEERPQISLVTLDIEIQSELPGMRSKADGINLSLAFVLQPGLQHVLGKHVPAEQKLMVLLQRIQRLVQRSRHRLHLGRLFGLQLI